MAKIVYIGGRKVTMSNAAVAPLTGITGTPDVALTDVGGAFAQATLNNNFADIATQLNAVIAAIKAAGITI
jgi:hypothetical protein